MHCTGQTITEIASVWTFWTCRAWYQASHGGDSSQEPSHLPAVNWAGDSNARRWMV